MDSPGSATKPEMDPAPQTGEALFSSPLLIEKEWGGNRLGALYGKNLPPGKRIGESWEVSDRGASQSKVTGGKFHGWTVRQLMERFPEALLGRELAARRPARFPLLAKYIDAGDTLSVQVHPSDEDCRRLGCSDRGKAECWVILEAQPGARISRGLKPGVTRAAFARPLHNGHMNEILRYLRVRPGDLIAIPPGMVHTIGPGIILAEIQQNSDVTFRVHDWHRAGADGEKRELHLEQALEIIRFDRPAEGFFDGDMTQGKLAEGVLDGSGSVVTGTILKGRYFHLSRTVLAPGVPFSPPGRPALPGIVMCVRGRGTLNGRPLAAGQTVLLPADLRKLWWSVPASEREPLVFLESTPMLEV